MGQLPIFVGPSQPARVVEAVTAAGGRLADFDDARAVVWLDRRPSTLPPLPPEVRWVQLGSAGAEAWLERVAATPGVAFTTAAGVYAAPMAEHALALLLAGVRRLVVAARATEWRQVSALTLEGATVAVIGAGGIGSALIKLLTALGAGSIAVTRRGLPVAGALETLPAARAHEVWPRADHFVVAAPATPATASLIGAAELAQMRPHSWIVNVSRGSLIDTDALVTALRRELIGGAALDVTEPEPLPDGHPLWREPRALISPHPGTSPDARLRHLSTRVRMNLERFLAGEPLIAPLDPAVGY